MSNRKKYLLFEVDNFITDTIQTWKKTDQKFDKFQTIMEQNPNFRLKIVKTNSNRTNGKLFNLYEEYFSKLSPHSVSLGVNDKFENANIRYKTQQFNLQQLRNKKYPTISVDGSFVPPCYAGWAGHSITGPIFVNSKILENGHTSIQAELEACLTAIQKIIEINLPFYLSTDSSFVFSMLNEPKEKTSKLASNQINKDQICKSTIHKIQESVETYPHLIFPFKTRSHKEDLANNFVDLESREKAKSLRSSQIKPLPYFIKQTQTKTNYFHTGRFITDLWNVYSKDDLKHLIEQKGTEVNVITDIKGDNNWLNHVVKQGAGHGFVDNYDDNFIAIKESIFKMRRNLNLLPSETIKKHQKTLLILITMMQNSSHFTTCIHNTMNGALVCNAWFETEMFKWFRFKNERDEKSLYQNMFDIAKFTDAKTSFIVHGESNIMNIRRGQVVLFDEKIEKSEKTILRLPKRKEQPIFELTADILNIFNYK